jgi:hypothetical protein
MTFCAPEIGREPSAEHFDRPCRDGRIFRTISRHFVPGYYQMSLRGPVLHASYPYVDAHGRRADRLRPPRRMRLPTASPARTALPAAHFERNESPSFVRRYTNSIGAQSDIPMSFAEDKMRVTP